MGVPLLGPGGFGYFRQIKLQWKVHHHGGKILSAKIKTKIEPSFFLKKPVAAFTLPCPTTPSGILTPTLAALDAHFGSELNAAYTSMPFGFEY